MSSKSNDESGVNLYHFDITGDKVTEVGFRTRIILELQRHHLQGEPTNVKDEEKVRVVVQGNEEQVRKFYDNLKKNPPKTVKNPVFHSIEPGGCAMPANMHEVATILTLEQIDQGIPLLKGMDENLKSINQSLEGVNKSLKGMDDNLKGMDKNLTGIDENLTGIDKKIESLPRRIAEELKAVLGK